MYQQHPARIYSKRDLIYLERHLGNLQDLYEENFKTPYRTQNMTNGEITNFLGRKIPTKIPTGIFLHLDKLTQKFIWKNKAGIARKTPKKNSEEELAFYNNFYYES